MSIQDTLATGSTIEGLVTTPATIDEDADHTIISNGTTIAEVGERSKIVKMDVFLEIGCESVSAPFSVSFLVYKDSIHGALAAPSSANNVLAPSTTLQLAELKKSTCQFERFLITANGDKRRFRLRVPRRLSFLKQGEHLSIMLTNSTAGAEDITYLIVGRIWSVRSK